MQESEQVLPPAGIDMVPPALVPSPAVLPRWFALLQVLLVCGIPTQIVAAVVLAVALRMPLFAGNSDTISFQFFATLSLIDTAMVALLIRGFLVLAGERSDDVFLGRRPVRPEILRGLALLPIVFVVVVSIVVGLRKLAPWLHNVDRSPLEAFMRTPFETAIFLFVVILAGGVREELQRAFILHRFEQRLGGFKVGLVLFTLTFGALHIDQGYDVALAIGVLGLFWGILYIRRGSAIAAMTNHASFNAAQVLQTVIARSLGA